MTTQEEDAAILRAHQEAIAALLVARGWAFRLKLSKQRTWKSIQLGSTNACMCNRCIQGNTGGGFIYVTEAGEILSGHTRREARPVGPQTRRRMLGEDDA